MHSLIQIRQIIFLVLLLIFITSCTNEVPIVYSKDNNQEADCTQLQVNEPTLLPLGFPKMWVHLEIKNKDTQQVEFCERKMGFFISKIFLRNLEEEQFLIIDAKKISSREYRFHVKPEYKDPDTSYFFRLVLLDTNKMIGHWDWENDGNTDDYIYMPEEKAKKYKTRIEECYD